MESLEVLSLPILRVKWEKHVRNLLGETIDADLALGTVLALFVLLDRRLVIKPWDVGLTTAGDLVDLVGMAPPEL